MLGYHYPNNVVLIYCYRNRVILKKLTKIGLFTMANGKSAKSNGELTLSIFFFFSGFDNDPSTGFELFHLKSIQFFYYFYSPFNVVFIFDIYIIFMFYLIC